MIERLAAESVAEDIDILLQGEAESLEETSNDVLMTYLFALVIVFLVLVAHPSLTSALVVPLTVPFALAAAILAVPFRRLAQYLLADRSRHADRADGEERHRWPSSPISCDTSAACAKRLRKPRRSASVRSA